MSESDRSTNVIKRLASIALFAGMAEPAYAHSLSWQQGVSALYHQLFGAHHLPLTMLLIVACIALLAVRRARNG